MWQPSCRCLHHKHKISNIPIKLIQLIFYRKMAQRWQKTPQDQVCIGTTFTLFDRSLAQVILVEILPTFNPTPMFLLYSSVKNGVRELIN